MTVVIFDPVSTAPTTVPVHPAGGSVDLDPGPLMVRVQCRGWADLADKYVTAPWWGRCPCGTY